MDSNKPLTNSYTKKIAIELEYSFDPDKGVAYLTHPDLRGALMLNANNSRLAEAQLIALVAQRNTNPLVPEQPDLLTTLESIQAGIPEVVAEFQELKRLFAGNNAKTKGSK